MDYNHSPELVARIVDGPMGTVLHLAKEDAFCRGAQETTIEHVFWVLMGRESRTLAELRNAQVDCVLLRERLGESLGPTIRTVEDGELKYQELLEAHKDELKRILEPTREDLEAWKSMDPVALRELLAPELELMDLLMQRDPLCAIHLDQRLHSMMDSAEQLALETGHHIIEEEHALAAILEQTDSIITELLRAQGADVEVIKQAALKRALSKSPGREPGLQGC